MPAHDETPSYDVFLSHNDEDEAAVEEIAKWLRDEAGLRPFLDKWHLVPGESWIPALERAIARSKAVAIFLGTAGVGDWNDELKQLALERVRHAQSRGRRVIPVLLPGGRKDAVEGFLKLRTSVDLSDDDGFIRLIAGVTGIAPEQLSELRPGPDFRRRIAELSPRPRTTEESAGTAPHAPDPRAVLVRAMALLGVVGVLVAWLVPREPKPAEPVRGSLPEPEQPPLLRGRVLLGGEVAPRAGVVVVDHCDDGPVDLSRHPDGEFELPLRNCVGELDPGLPVGVQVRLPLATYEYSIPLGEHTSITPPRFDTKPVQGSLGEVAVFEIWPAPRRETVVDFGDRLWFPLPNETNRGFEVAVEREEREPSEVTWSEVDRTLGAHRLREREERVVLSHYAEHVPKYRGIVVDRLLRRAEVRARRGTCSDYDAALQTLDGLSARGLSSPRIAPIREPIKSARRILGCPERR